MKKIISWVLFISMLLAVLSGCSSPSGTATTNGQGNEGTAKGRYVEVTIELPFDKTKYTVSQGIARPDNKIELVAYESGADGNKGGEKSFLFDGTEWKEQDLSWIQDRAIYSGAATGLVAGQDGFNYICYTDEEYRFHIGKQMEDGTTKELLESVLGVKREGRDYYPIPDLIEVLKDGSILVSESSEAVVYTPEGNVISKVSQGYTGYDRRVTYILNGNEYITTGDKSFVRYDLTTGSQIEEIPFQGDNDGGSPQLLRQGEQGDLYLANNEGIHHIGKGGSVWETIVDGNLNSIGMPSQIITAFFLGKNDDFYVVLNQNQNSQMLHYTYDPEMPSVPSKTLTIYGLYDSPTVREAAALLQKSDPDVRVDVRFDLDETGGATKADIIRALNTELLNGNGADIIILDGLPVESYIEKGVLMDMKDTLKPLMDSGQLLTNVAENFIDEKGSIYSMPSRIILPIAFGEDKAVEALASLDAVKAYQEAGNQSLMPMDTYSNLVLKLCNYNYYEIFDSETEGFKEGSLEKVLETAKAIGDRNNSKVTFTDEEADGNATFYNVLNGNFRSLAIDYEYGETSLAVARITGMSDLLFPWAIMNKHEKKPNLVNGIYYPKEIAGINNASKQKELAEEFITILFSADIQTTDFNDGLPINPTSLDVWQSIHQEYSMATGGGDNAMISAEWPKEEEIKIILDMTKQLTNPINPNEVLMEMIVNESIGYFEGTMSVQEAVAAINNKAQLYFAE